MFHTLSRQTVTYLKESENLLLVSSVHITFLKQQEVWDKSIAWSNMPGIQKEGSLSVDVPVSTLWLGSRPRFTSELSKKYTSQLQWLCHGYKMTEATGDINSMRAGEATDRN